MVSKSRKSSSLAGMDHPKRDMGSASFQSGPVDNLCKEPSALAGGAEQGYNTTANARQVGGSHYQRGIQHWDYVLSKGIPYMEAQIIKYVERWEEKNGIQDLYKAQHFLEKLIEHAKEKERLASSAITRGW